MDQPNHLIEAMQQGNEKAFSTIYQMYSGAIHGVIYTILKDRDLSEEVLQDVFVKVWNNCQSYTIGKGRFYTWLLNIARNAAIDKTRSKDFKNSNKNLSTDNFVDILAGHDNLSRDLIARLGKAGMATVVLIHDLIPLDFPDFARAHAGLSHTYWWLLLQRTLHDPGDAPKLMRHYAEAAVDADPDDPAANLAMGKALSLGKRRELAPEWIERSVELSPSYAMGHTQMAAFHAFAGPFENAMEHGELALMLSPRDPMRYSTYAAQSIAQFNLGDVQAAAHWGRMAQSVPHEDLMIMVTALCAIFISGEKEEAAGIADHIRDVFPTVTIAGIEKANPYMGEKVRPVVQTILAMNGFE